MKSEPLSVSSNLIRIDPVTFDTLQDEIGNPLLDEEFTETIAEFKKWCLGQEKALQDLFLDKE